MRKALKEHKTYMDNHGGVGVFAMGSRHRQLMARMYKRKMARLAEGYYGFSSGEDEPEEPLPFEAEAHADAADDADDAADNDADDAADDADDLSRQSMQFYIDVLNQYGDDAHLHIRIPSSVMGSGLARLRQNGNNASAPSEC
ncbi:hypothetical protein MUCCIDRAFT_157587 [Mucor lusitanicus CBS 277.49]|uniref:Uncharacterized protein n=1 Tax=Mucor lusitanicus CBS 277.49 TaxID=747725 RepID=A0A168GJE5_MUCCL|nr:hypothetical protein MUCCIDRAFT_157587 [Mucor lusitanicus CBS 277.49]